jgi:hypothetical protein
MRQVSIDFLEIRQRFPLKEHCLNLGIKLERYRESIWVGKCPLHDDGTPSFYVYPDHFHCFGCEAHGDVTDLERSLGGGSILEAAARLRVESSELERSKKKRPSNKKDQRAARPPWNWPPLLRLGTSEEFLRVALTRNLSINGPSLASKRGLLKFLEHPQGLAWVVCDRLLENAVARLVSGNPFKGGQKARMLQGSRGKRPIGLIEAMAFPVIWAVEGTPDLLSAFHWIAELGLGSLVAPICMPSTGSEFESGDLARLRAKTIKICSHADQPGREAAERWRHQLSMVARRVQVLDLGISFPGIKDLNDLAKVGSGKDWLRTFLAF